MLTPTEHAVSCYLSQLFLLITHNNLKNHHILEVTQIASVENVEWGVIMSIPSHMKDITPSILYVLFAISEYLIANCNYQPGLLRTASETCQCLDKQLDLACFGKEKPILDKQTATGTKDKIAQYWIDILLQKCRKMRSNQPEWSPESVADELRQWLKAQPGEKINPLLSIDGIHSVAQFCT